MLTKGPFPLAFSGSCNYSLQMVGKRDDNAIHTAAVEWEDNSK